MFQFQTGSIKSLNRRTATTPRLLRFNSKLVRLKGIIPAKAPAEISCFNSKLVRLKVKARLTQRCAPQFQFQTGSIKRKPRARARGLQGGRFNSKLVRLKEQIRTDTVIAKVGFNSKLVRLKAVSSSETLERSEVRFNSKLVRLKGSTSSIVFRCTSLFQFQTGSIKRMGWMPAASAACQCFNSKLVRLKDQARTAVARRRRGFNSKLVRLKVQSVVRRAVAAEFQFQTGSIKSVRYIYLCAWYREFQFQTGSIKRTVLEQKRSISDVSIPNWFD